MQIEHLAINAQRAEEMVAWYSAHCRMPVWHEGHADVYVGFLGVPPSLVEIYNNPDRPYLLPGDIDPATIHLAFQSNDLVADRDRLIAAGATLIEGEPTEDGYGLLMLRCLWFTHPTVQPCGSPRLAKAEMN